MRFRKCCGLLLLAVGMLAMLSGCNFSGEHEHTYTKWSVTKEASCVDQGVQSRECEECGYMQSESIPALGHTTTKDAAVKATCTEDGWTEGSHCSACGQVLQAQQAIPAFGHAALVDYEIKATCISEGLTEGSHCALCGVTIVEQEVVPASGHVYDEGAVVTPATCKQLGTMRYSCLYCDTSYLDTYATTEHAVVIDPAVQPTCLEDGLTEGSHCRDCNLVFVAQTAVPAMGHLPVTDPAAQPDCTTDGCTEGTHCQNCGEVLAAPEVIPALGHVNEEVILQEATCQTPGLKQYTCTVCGYVSEGAYTLQPCTEKELYSTASTYVCQIVTYDKNGNAYGGGIGFVYTSDGQIVTCYQTIHGAYSAYVHIGNDSYAVEQVLAYDSQLDIAVLKISASGLKPVKTCQIALNPGDSVYALSAPRGLSNTYTQGAILTSGREVNNVIYLHHNAQITADNAGGPLLNVYGEVIGINTYAVSQSQRTNLALPVAQLALLDYSQPKTLLQIYQQDTSPFRKLVDNIYAYGSTDAYDNIVVYGSDTGADSFYIYELGYNAADGRICLNQFNKSQAGQQIDTALYFSDGASAVAYSCSFSIEDTVYNRMQGVLQAESYDPSDALTYDSSEGMQGYESTLRIRYRDDINRMLNWLDAYLRVQMGMSIADLGFTGFAN